MRHPFTRCDFVAAVMCVVASLALLAPAVAQTRAKDGRQSCAANLSKIAMQMVVYANENVDVFPSVGSPSAKDYSVSFKASPAKDGASAIAAMSSKHAGEPLACLWLLAAGGQVAPKVFVCPEDPRAKEPAKDKNAKNEVLDNFTDATQVSYSLAYPWAGENDRTWAPGWWKSTGADSSTPILADMAPFAEPKADPVRNPAADSKAKGVSGKTYNSGNHDFAGQNVAFGDGHAEWLKDPRAGQDFDNIWTVTIKGKPTAIPGGGIGSPVETQNPPWDIVMVPARDSAGKIR